MAADLHEKLFELVHDDRRIAYGSAAVEYLSQYVKLDRIKEKVWAKLAREGIPSDTEPDHSAPILLSQSVDPFEYFGGYYCIHVWYAGGHHYASILVDGENNLQYGTIEGVAKLLADVFPDCVTARQAEAFLRDVLRVLPYESIVISSARDIRRTDTTGLRDGAAAMKEREWQSFVEGVGRSIAPPTESYSRYGEAYTIHVYQRFGGKVIRYRLRFLGGRYVSIEEEVIARWIGDCWGIM